ncbi:MAG: ABC transporter ATP-binding protein [Candidatus Promineifilaceae bacterium]
MSIAEFNIAKPIQSNQSTPLRWLTSHLVRNWYLLISLAIGAAGNASLATVIPTQLDAAFTAAQGSDLTGIGWAAITIVISQCVRAVLQFGRNFSAAMLGERLERDTREELYISLLGKSMTFHDLTPVGDTMARATNDVREMNLMITQGFNLVIGSSFFIIAPLVVAPLNYGLPLIAAPLFFTIGYIFALTNYLNTLSPLADKVRGSFGVLNSRLAEAIDGIETVKGAAQEEAEIGRFQAYATSYRDAVIQQGRVEARFIPQLLLGITIAGAFTHSILLYQSGVFEVGDVIGYTGLMTLFGFPTFISLFAYAQVARGMAGARRILELIKTETEFDENSSGHGSTIKGNIRFKNVSAGYLPGIDVLHNITFDVSPGQTVAIVGQTGSGKSSLVKLINRTYDTRQGAISIDGVDVRKWNLADLRRQISIIEQDIFLFSRTIRENIAFGKPQATHAEVEQAARDAQAHEFILTFPEGYDTVIGTRGVTLSGGQRQRIALARAFLAEPRILVLDDSTSAVDSATEDKIQKAIARAAERQTTFLITHRLSQIRWADKVVLLRGGHVVAVGNHDSLMTDYPAYRRIFEQYQ